MIGYIYKVTNKTTGMCYIGQSYRCANLRWNHHLSEAKRGYSQSKFHLALRAYDITNWTFEVLFFETKKVEESENDFYTRLTELEGYYIKQFDSFVNGYNSRNSLSVEERGKKIKTRGEIVRGRWW